MKKAIKVVGALDLNEVNQILVTDKSDNVAEIIPLEIDTDFFEKMSWWNDFDSKKMIEDEISEGPFRFIVLFRERV